jgi:nicotinamide-nucleotide amidase
MHELVVTTGGLGPTHDDITRDAAASALGLPLIPDATIAAGLADMVARHSEARAREAVLVQALVLEGALVLPAVTGTAPGQVAPTQAGMLALLPGPPSEMRPMLARFLEQFEAATAEPVDLGITGMSESDVQYAAQRALEAFPDVVFTVLAKPGDVRALLIDGGAGDVRLAEAGVAVAAEIGPACYATDGSTLAEALLRACAAADVTIATAESCTGGLVSAAITDVPGSSAAYQGGVVSYANAVKSEVLGVPEGLLAQFGAVSEQTARAMAEGVRELTQADLAVAITGVAGPDGGTDEKPVGLVWFAIASDEGTHATSTSFSRGDRAAIRARAVSKALDLLRRAALER